jgi:hypothetical protein
VGEQIGAKLMLPEALITCGTFCDGVAPAISEEQHTFLSAQIAGSLAIEMDQVIAAESNGIVL